MEGVDMLKSYFTIHQVGVKFIRLVSCGHKLNKPLYKECINVDMHVCDQPIRHVYTVFSYYGPVYVNVVPTEFYPYSIIIIASIKLIRACLFT